MCYLNSIHIIYKLLYKVLKYLYKDQKIIQLILCCSNFRFYYIYFYNYCTITVFVVNGHQIITERTLY